MVRRLIVALAVSSALSIAACAQAATSPDGQGATAAVSMESLAYDPRKLSVETGTTVTWTNAEDVVHNIQWLDGSGASPDLPNGGSYSRTFDVAGSFDYLCTLHQAMRGTVTVG